MAKLIEYQGQRYLRRELAAKLGIPLATLQKRIERGTPLDQPYEKHRKSRKILRPAFWGNPPPESREEPSSPPKP